MLKMVFVFLIIHQIPLHYKIKLSHSNLNSPCSTFKIFIFLMRQEPGLVHSFPSINSCIQFAERVILKTRQRKLPFGKVDYRKNDADLNIYFSCRRYRKIRYTKKKCLKLFKCPFIWVHNTSPDSEYPNSFLKRTLSGAVY